MKRIKRNPEKFEAVDLFTAVGREQGYEINNPEDREDFLSRIGESLKTAHQNDTLLHGKRVEALFAHVAGALGECEFIKQEDRGDIYSESRDILPPDYKVVLKSGDQFFIEVKNCNLPHFKHKFTLKKKYIRKLEKYSQLHSTPLKFAIYFSSINKWVLLSKESFVNQKNKIETNVINAMAMNEFDLLGDRMLGILPNLTVEIIGDKSKDATLSEDGVAKFIIGNINIYNSGKLIQNEIAKNIAFYLIRFGGWEESEAEAIIENEKLLGIKFEYTSEHINKRQQFQIVGDLSSMIISAYKEHTVYNQQIVTLDTKSDPDIFSVKIPKNFKCEELPLWQFSMQPNDKFLEANE